MLDFVTPLSGGGGGGITAQSEETGEDSYTGQGMVLLNIVFIHSYLYLEWCPA